MRTESEMKELILRFARDHDDVRAVVMTGSRANPEAGHDRFQDYDITYLVEDVAPYRNNAQIPASFGDIMILQRPDDARDSPSAAASYAYLMQFIDGNRIDLTFLPVNAAHSISKDSLSLVLLDKDRRFDLPPPTLLSYLAQKPTAKQFTDCCNEYWWLNPYVAKGLYRKELTYAKSILDELMRHQLMDMLTWYVGVTTNFQVAVGYLARNLKAHISSDLWERLERTYSDAQPPNIWHSLFAMNELFRRVAQPTANALKLPYLDREDAAVSQFVGQIYRQAVPEQIQLDCPPRHGGISTRPARS
jgi:aminoglycoside 6-adenylyltransferase